MANRRRNAAQNEDGLRIKNKQSFINSCEAGLRKFTGARKIGHTILTSSSGESHFFGNDSLWKPSDESRTRPVIYLHDGGNDFYWASVSIDFKLKPNEIVLLTHVSIKVITGQATSTDKRLRFRAEWDARSAHHAQPHWHIHPISFVEGEMSSMDSFQEYLEKQTLETRFIEELSIESTAKLSPSALTWPSSEAIHFAMAAQWHSSQVDHGIQLDDEKFVPVWLYNCLTYIRSQLNHAFSDATSHEVGGRRV